MSCDSQLALLRGALAAAVAEIDEHNAEYKHTTPKSKIDFWRALAGGDPVAEALRPSSLRETIGAFEIARRYFAIELPRWEDDGGAPAGELGR